MEPQAPSERAIQYLRDNPDAAHFFDEKYGAGASTRYLQQQDTPEDSKGGFLSAVGDVAGAGVDGVRDGVQEVLDLTKGMSDWVDKNVGTVVIGGQDGFIDFRSAEEMQQKPAEGVQIPDITKGDAETGVGNVVHGITQFLTGYALGGRLLRAAKPTSLAGKTGKAFVQGGVADFVAFDEHEKRLSNMINEYFPEHSTMVTEYLAANEDDPMLEGRLKNVLEGGALGVLAEGGMAVGRGMFRMIKATRDARKLIKAGQEKDAMNLVEEASAKAEKELEMDPKSTYVPEDVTYRNAAEADKVVVKAPIEDPDIPRAIVKDADVEQAIKNLGDEAKAFENIDASAGKGGINPNTWTNAGSAKQVIDSLAAIIRKRSQDAFGGTLKFDAMKVMAKKYSMEPEELVRNMRSLGIATKDMPQQLLATDMVLKKIGEQISAIAVEHGTKMADYPPEALKQITDLIKVMGDLYTSRGLAQKNAARTVASGRVVEQEAEGTIDFVDGMLKAITDERDFSSFTRMAIRASRKKNNFARELHKSFSGRTVDKLNEFWINSLLSHPRTHMINMLTGSIESVVRPLEDALGNALVGDFKGAMGQVVGAYQGFRYSMRSSRKLVDELMQINSVDDMTIDDLSEIARSSPLYNAMQAALKEVNILDPFVSQIDDVEHAIKGTKGQIIRSPSRLLAAEDEFMKQVNYRNKILMDEYAIGYRNGLSHEQIAKNAADRLDRAFVKETDKSLGLTKGEANDMVALQYARETTFTQDLERGFGHSIQQLVGKHPAMRQLMPFVRVPVNLFRHSWQRFPVIGLFQRDMQLAFREGGSRLQKGRVMAKQLIGLGLAASAWDLAQSETITGYGPKDTDLRRQWMLTHQPYSVKSSDGEWIQYNRLDPRFSVFGLIADVHETYENIAEGERDGLLTALPAAIARNLSSKAFYTSISDFLTAAESGDAKQLEGVVRQHVASYVPNIVTMFTGATDDELKAPHSLLDAVMARIPGLSARVDPKRNLLGEPVLRTGALGPDAISPIFTKPQSNNELDAMLAESNHKFTLPPKKVRDTRINLLDYTNESGQSAWDRYQELTGTVKLGKKGKNLRKALEDMVPTLKRLPTTQDPEYDHVTSERDAEIVSVIRQYREVAFQKMLQEFPELRTAIQKQKAEAQVVSQQGKEGLKKLEGLINH